MSSVDWDASVFRRSAMMPDLLGGTQRKKVCGWQIGEIANPSPRPPFEGEGLALTTDVQPEPLARRT